MLTLKDRREPGGGYADAGQGAGLKGSCERSCTLRGPAHSAADTLSFLAKYSVWEDVLNLLPELFNWKIFI